MSVCLRDRSGVLRYNFTLIDSIFDFLLSIGMKPFVELSFLPSALASSGSESWPPTWWKGTAWTKCTNGSLKSGMNPT